MVRRGLPAACGAHCRVVIASNEVPQAATLAAFRIARAAGVTTLLSPAPVAALPDELLATR